MAGGAEGLVSPDRSRLLRDRRLADRHPGSIYRSWLSTYGALPQPCSARPRHRLGGSSGAPRDVRERLAVDGRILGIEDNGGFRREVPLPGKQQVERIAR